MTDPLLHAGYPALFHAADTASLSGQRRFFVALKFRLAGLILGALGGGVLVALQLYVIGGWVALIGFAAALIAELYTAIEQPDRRWYEGRAAAESVKTLAWRYAARGESFDSSLSAAEADARLVARVEEVLNDLDGLGIESSEKFGSQISSRMREIRDETFDERRRIYCEGRVENQRVWYARRAKWNRTRLHAWTLGILIAEGLGLLGGVLTIVGVLSLDLLGLIAALTAVAAAWTQARQYSALATAYGITAQELASVIAEASRVVEADWADFVGGAEGAISREHTLWTASRGLRIRSKG